MPLSGGPAVSNFGYTPQFSAAKCRKLIFYGEMVEPVWTKLCIKFVRRYLKDAHLICESNGYAPALPGFKELPGDWYTVVMEVINSHISYNDIRLNTVIFSNKQQTASTPPSQIPQTLSHPS
jgi:hypothetical protein